MRAEPDATATKVGFIKGGSATRHDILGQDAAIAAWWQIRYSPTIVGWVSGSHVQTYGHLHGLAVTWTAPPQLSLKSTATYNLNVRAQPDATAAKVGFIPGGSTARYDILARNAAPPPGTKSASATPSSAGSTAVSPTCPSADTL